MFLNQNKVISNLINFLTLTAYDLTESSELPNINANANCGHFLEEIIHVAGERGSFHLHENICRGREETWKQRKETRNLFGCRQQPFLHNGAKMCGVTL